MTSVGEIVIEEIINTVVKNPGITVSEMSPLVKAAVTGRVKRSVFFNDPGLHIDVHRLVEVGKLRELESPTGFARYYTPEQIPLCFDISKETDRLVAADYVQERDDEDTAKALREAQSGSVFCVKQPLESWRKVWRDGFVPSVSTPALEALAKGLRADTKELIQGATTHPPPLACVQDWPCEGGDAIAYAGWRGDELATVGEVEEFFARLCFEADQRLGEPAACRFFLNWFDDCPRDEMRRDLLVEVERALADRRSDQSPNSGGR